MLEAPRAAVERSVRLEIETTCGACGGPVGVAGVHLHSNCASCGEPLELTVQTWTLLCKELDEKSFEASLSDATERQAEQATEEGKLVARYRLGAPACGSCGTDLPHVEPGSDQSVVCTQCATETATFPAPGWLRTELPTAMQLYAASRDAQPSARAFWLTFQGTPPALNERREHVLKNALGSGPDRPAVTAPAIDAPKRRRWEWYVIIAMIVVIVAGVRECGRRAARSSDAERENAVEPGQ
ncbi:MAG: hypothetical protein U0263_18300 [Polyangiaceae bacterium]